VLQLRLLHLLRLNILFFVFVFVSHTAEAQGLQIISAPNENQTLFLNCLENNQFASANANITIYYPNASIFINNTPLNSIGTGKFDFNFITPNILGNYEVDLICQFTASGNIAESTGGFQVKDIEKEVGLEMLGAIILILGFIALVLYFAKKEYEAGGLHYPIGLFLYFIAIIMSLLITYFLRFYFENSTLFGIFETIFLVHTIFVVAFIVILLIVIILETFSQSIGYKRLRDMLQLRR
jgi:hypothetical protein